MYTVIIILLKDLYITYYDITNPAGFSSINK